ncbi:hypothetical protein [Marinibacterium sp. SX1]|uniref:hypothetical protein n=1 Tax=Marinibacterium sp. SX1 TaxID=3388424 RepID=UPI003D163FC0
MSEDRGQMPPGENLVGADLVGPDVSWHVPELGQSLGVGCDEGGRVLTPPGAVPAALWMFNGGIRPLDGCGVVPARSHNQTPLPVEQIDHLVPAREASNGRFHETHLTALGATLLDRLAVPPARIVLSAHGFGWSAYAAIRKGQPAYANAMAAVAAHVRLARAAGLRPVVPFVTMVHGESDAGLSRAAYAGHLREFLADLRADIRAATGQAQAPFLLIGQTGAQHWGRVSDVALAQLEVSGADILCAGPKYQWDFSDPLHLTSDGYRRMGEQMGAMAAARLAGQRAGPLRPVALERVDARRIRLRFEVPVPPLRIDPAQGVGDPGDCGIEVYVRRQGWLRVAVRAVGKAGPASVILRLGEAVEGLPVHVRLGMSGTGRQGPQTGPRTVIHDSETAIGVLTGAPLTHWCAHAVLTDPPEAAP